jgi:hypothetical protein
VIFPFSGPFLHGHVTVQLILGITLIGGSIFLPK